MPPSTPARPDHGRRPAMAWNAWGDPGHASALPKGADKLLRRELGVGEGLRTSVPLAAVAVPSSRLADAARDRLAGAVGADEVRMDRESRIRRAGGRSYPDLVRLRAGDAAHAPDAVVRPGTHDEVRQVLGICAEEGVAVVPFGGGTSVVGGVEALRGSFEAVIALDLARMDRLVALDPVAGTATFEPGLRGVEAEALLAERGHTLGHFPQSFEFATIGGFVVTRSAGQASTGYGRIDDLVERVRCATPVGDLDLGRAPGTAAGPDLLELVVGSEGTLGVLTEVTLRVRRTPAARRYEGWALPSWEAGQAALRDLAQEGPSPDVARLSDRDETRVALAQADGVKGAVLGGLLRVRRRRDGCLAIMGFDGTADDVAHRRRGVAKTLKRHGGKGLGQAVGRSWEHGRYHGPYLRDALMDRGVLVETLETAADWTRLPELYAEVRSALRGALTTDGRPPVVLCHISHLYPTGASLYFTFIAPVAPGAELDRWQEAKQAAGDAIAGVGATITHHHAVGRDHLPWMDAEVGALGLEALRAVKNRLDPEGILNPGKLIPVRPA
jgi:alkyldihydroxyacetonephosphate synthase